MVLNSFFYEHGVSIRRFRDIAEIFSIYQYVEHTE